MDGRTPWILGYPVLTIRILQAAHEEDLATVSELMTGKDLQDAVQAHLHPTRAGMCLLEVSVLPLSHEFNRAAAQALEIVHQAFRGGIGLRCARLHILSHDEAIDEGILCLHNVPHHITDRADLLVLHRFPLKLLLAHPLQRLKRFIQLRFHLRVFLQRFHAMLPPLSSAESLLAPWSLTSVLLRRMAPTLEVTPASSPPGPPVSQYSALDRPPPGHSE